MLPTLCPASRTPEEYKHDRFIEYYLHLQERIRQHSYRGVRENVRPRDCANVSGCVPRLPSAVREESNAGMHHQEGLQNRNSTEPSEEAHSPRCSPGMLTHRNTGGKNFKLARLVVQNDTFFKV